MLVKNMEFHPISNLFPLMGSDDFSRLCEDIKANGLIEPIWVHDGQIIDGRNRFRACQQAGVEPHFKEWDGSGSLIQFVVSLNVARRHLNSSQLAVVALEVEAKLAEMAKERQREAGKQYGECHPKQEVPEIVPEPLESDSGDDCEVVSDPEEQKPSKNESRFQAAKICNTNPRYVSDAKRIAAEAPALLDQIRAGAKTIPEAKKEIKRIREEEQKAELAEAGKDVEPDHRFEMHCGDFRKILPIPCDVIVTDPPYSEQYLSLFNDLSRLAAESLATGGLLIVMCGQYYLPQIHEMLGKHLGYLWTAAYLTPGGQAVQVFPRKVNTFWKPLLIYSKGTYFGKWFGDVCKSNINENDKRFHEWGQSESGMLDVIERWTEPGQTVLDPLCGASTTGCAAVASGRKYIGIDLLQENVDISLGRLTRIENGK